MTDSEQSGPFGDEELGEKLESLADRLPLGKIAEELHSRRFLLAGGLGAIFGGLVSRKPEAFFQAAHAAPTDILGSPNVAVGSFRNKQGDFILYSDGSIADSSGNRTNPSQYSLAKGFKKPSQVRGKPAGSPNIAVGTIQNDDGTFVLFADGSVKEPNLAGAKAPPFSSLQYHYYAKQGTTPEILSPGFKKSGRTLLFSEPYKETPLGMVFKGSTGRWHLYCNGYTGMCPIDTHGIGPKYMRDPSSTDHEIGVIIGKV